MSESAHPAATHCDGCGCDWLDNGLNPIGCPYCSWTAEVERLRAEVAEWKRVAAAQAELHGEAEARAERLAEAINAYKSEWDNPVKDYLLRAKRRDEMFALLRDEESRA